MIRCWFMDVFNLHLNVDSVHDVIIIFVVTQEMLSVVDANLQNWIQYLEQKDILCKYCTPMY